MYIYNYNLQQNLMGYEELDMTERLHFHALEKEMQPTPVFPWRIPEIAEPGGLPSMGSHRVGHDWSDLAAAAAAAVVYFKIVSSNHL